MCYGPLDDDYFHLLIVTDSNTFCQSFTYLNVETLSSRRAGLLILSLSLSLFARYSFETSHHVRGEGPGGGEERRVLGLSVKPLFVAANVPCPRN